MTVEIPLGEAAELVMGTSPRGDTYNQAGEGLPLLNGPTEFGPSHPRSSVFTTDPKRAALPGDLLFCVRGSTTGRMNWADQEYAIGRGVAAIRGRTELETKFIRYCLEARLPALLQRIGGGTFPNLRRQDIASFPIPYPDDRLEIASIISAYDELVANNARRIYLLDSMAFRIYREWFGVPSASSSSEATSNYELVPIADAFDVVGGATPSTKKSEYWDGGTINWFTPRDLTAHGQLFIERSARRISEEGLRASSAKLFPPGHVMMTSRATLGVVAINTEPACTNQGFITCIPNQRVPSYYILYWIRDNLETIVNHASGATFKEISKAVFKSLEFPLPSPEAAARFMNVVGPKLDLIEVLTRMTDRLVRTRHLLLPGLISGEIDVSELEIDTAWLAA